MMQSLREYYSNLAGARRSDPGAVVAARSGAFWLLTMSAAAAWLIPLLWLHAHNSRLLPSWHGFLHAAIATRFPGAAPPENPFFAGERLPYYWFYHYVASLLGRLTGADLLHTFQFIALSSLVILVVFAALIGRVYFRSPGAGLLIGYLALVGVNPLGPAIAAAKYSIAGWTLLDSHDGPVESVFVSNALADELMTQPLLPALYIFADWRFGQNIAWFLDISSRTPALALIMVMLFLLLGWRPAIIRAVPIILVGALATAFNPLIGITASGSLAMAFIARALWQSRYRGVKSGEPGPMRSAFFLCLSLLAGPALALPAYYHLLSLEGTSGMTGAHYIGVKIAKLVFSYLLLVPLALLGLRLAPGHIAERLSAVTLAGFLLLLAATLIDIEPMNDHNLANIAQCLLAAPAVAWIPGLTRSGASGSRWNRLWPALVFAAFLPMTICALVAYTGRPGLPLEFQGRTLHRGPNQDSLDQFYDWVRSQTPADAVFICDPMKPVKMSGNVAEFPAFTERVLFTDHPTYLTRPYKDAALRVEIATAAAAGDPLTPTQLGYLGRLRRALYLITYQADDQERVKRLSKLHGAPVFRQRFIAAFKFAMPAVTASELTLSVSALLTGSKIESARDIAVDRNGNIYITGGTTSPDFPVTPGAFQTTHNPGTPEAPEIAPFDVFVIKLDPVGNLIWSTFIGGPNYERAYAIEVDRDGYIYVAGRAGRDFPVTAGAFQTSFMGGQEADFYGPQDGFIAKLAPDGTKLVWASYFGTDDPSIIRDLALNQSGEVYIASGHSAGAYPQAVERAFNNAAPGGRDAVVARIKSDGSEVLWATYLGGSGWESNENSVRLDASGAPYALLTTESTDITTTTSAFDRTFGGDQDFYVAKLTADEGKLVWGSYLGGPQNESTETHEFAVDAVGNVYVAGPTRSASFPITTGAFQSAYGGGGNEIVVAKLSADGTQLLASTFIGGDGFDRPEGMAVDDAGNVYFTGTTTSTNFPVTYDAFQSVLRGTRDAVIVELAADFSHLRYSSYLGGGGAELGRAARVDKAGNIYLAGETDSNDWPTRFTPIQAPKPKRTSAEVGPNDQSNLKLPERSRRGGVEAMFAKLVHPSRRQGGVIDSQDK